MKIVIDIPENVYKASKLLDVKHEDVIQIPLGCIKNGVPLTEQKSKQQFEKLLHDMFDCIWDTEIDHPMFQDTIGELMEDVIQVYNKAAQPERTCRGCKHEPRYPHDEPCGSCSNNYVNKYEGR